MTALTEPLDRIAQSHIEGRVQPVRRPAALTPNRCVHCGASYNDTMGYYTHARHCPCNQRGTK